MMFSYAIFLIAICLVKTNTGSSENVQRGRDLHFNTFLGKYLNLFEFQIF